MRVLERDTGRRPRAASLVGVVLLTSLVSIVLGGCGSPGASGTATPAPSAETSAPVASEESTPGPFTIPAEYLVIPEMAQPNIGMDVSSIESAVRRAFGPMLASVTVEATAVADPEMPFEFLISYRLIDCDTPVSTFEMDVSGTGIIPPLTQISDTAPGRDWMAPDRFRVLLRAFGSVAGLPAGQLESYSTAMHNNLDRRLPIGQTTATVEGKTRPIKDLWVVTQGSATLADFRKLYAKPGHNPAGYVFYFPEGSGPEYLGTVPGLGAFSVLLDD